MSNCGESGDFGTALGLLLSRGDLRDAFRENRRKVAESFDLPAEEANALLELAPEQLEKQAEVLLRKRLDSIRARIPETAELLGRELWPRFRAYARKGWENDGGRDAELFLTHLQANGIKIASAERRVLAFRMGLGLFGAFWCYRWIKGKRRACLTVLRRTRRGVEESVFYLSL